MLKGNNEGTAHDSDDNDVDPQEVSDASPRAHPLVETRFKGQHQHHSLDELCLELGLSPDLHCGSIPDVVQQVVQKAELKRRDRYENLEKEAKIQNGSLIVWVEAARLQNGLQAGEIWKRYKIPIVVGGIVVIVSMAIIV